MWTPPASLTDHQGNRLDPQADFFMAPPAEIGAIRSAYTSLNKTKGARTIPVRIAITAAFAIIGFLLIWGFNFLSKIIFVIAEISHTPEMLWILLLTGLPAYWGWRFSAFRHFCTFAGQFGCAEYRCEGERSRIVQRTVFLFRQAGALSTGATRRSRNGVYQGTYYFYAWYTPDRSRILYHVKGQHFAEKKKPGPWDPYCFVLAVEKAWYAHLAPQLQAQFATQGYVKFYMGDQNSAILGRGFLEFVDPWGKASRCAADEIGSARLCEGILTIRRKDARKGLFNLFNQEGFFTFNYSGIHNARLFLSLFEQALGVPVQ
ncbi:MAG TPA: hypothetical protein VML19_25510 [Verrucomicrobiae bacterium]|nr:hypothetical protein [Verrucomicrobiae bacterium]